MSSILGAQSNRLDEIDHERKLNAPEKVKAKDNAIHDLLTDENYQFPLRQKEEQ